MFKIISTCKGGGYRYCRTNPPHPKANAKGLYPLHRVLMENKLGRLLERGEHVHHRDENKTNDSPQNLEVVAGSEHARRHAVERAPAPARFNCRCGKAFELTPSKARTRLKRSLGNEIFCSRSCGRIFAAL